MELLTPARTKISVQIWCDPESKAVGGRRARRDMRTLVLSERRTGLFDVVVLVHQCQRT